MIYIVWRFTAKAERIAEFEKHYGPQGTWAQLFARAGGYYGTELLREEGVPHSYLLWDMWDSLGDFDRFKKEHSEDYAALDRACEALTVQETKIGVFTDAPRH